ncbi:MAG TPA: hypothetical protein VF024_13980, partial [Solirubrobacteraceae bacterium]
GILLISSEWSQRTGLTTFALVPRRLRVVAAKLLASVVLSLVALALCIVVAIAGTAVAAPGLDTVVRWLDPTSSLAPMTEHLMDATEWAHGGATLALWMVLPLVVGLWRIQRGEIR